MSSDPNLPPSYESNPLPPAGGTSAPLTTEVSQATSTGLAPNLAAGLSAIFTIIGGIVFFILEKRNSFVRFWAMQSIFFGAAWFIFGIVSAVISSVLVHILGILAVLWGLVALLINLGFVIVWIITIVQAFSGKAWEIPVLGRMARQQLAKTPLL